MTRVELGNGMWVELRDDLSMGDVEKINQNAQRYDADSNSWVRDPLYAAIEAVPILVVEWALPGAPPPTPDGLRQLPAKLGMKVQRVLDKHLLAQGLSETDLTDGSGN